MQVQHYRDTTLFLERAGPFLLSAEAENNMFLGMGGQAAVLGEQCYLATVERAEEVVACAVRTPPYGLVITRAEPSALDALVEDLIGKYETLPSVLGPEPTVSAFAQRWSKRVGTRTRPLMQMRMFEARQIQVPAVPPPGGLRLALESDLPMITAWVVAFHQEAQTGDPLDAARVTREAVAKKRVFIWDDRGAKSVAIYASRTERSARIGLAYTSPAHRGQGYASACVAALTQRLLSEGLVFCCINADLANATTNKIYPAIGYRPVCDTSNIDLNAG
jgi:predicted GNAT family acetyltransferase